MKSVFKSKTFWVATIQAILGAVVVYSTAYPQIGVLVMAKSVLDIFLRVTTEAPVTLK